MAAGKFNNVAVVVQCRLSSTRLPQKALKALGQKECLCWTLDAMKKVKAGRYFLACDYDSKSALEPLAQKSGWEIFAGPKDDVLERFCSLIKSEFPECDLIVRATGDNPFLFWEAAEDSVKDFEENSFDADYFTYTGLPHGSGVELFKAASIIKAQGLTDSPYDKEHVGPALYRHPENFSCVFKPAPQRYLGADLRTTIDTFADYCRARRLQAFLSEQGAAAPFCAKDIMAVLSEPSLQKTILLVPSVKAGRGTGHLRRALSLARETGAFVYVPDAAPLGQAAALVQEALASGLKDFQVLRGPAAALGSGWDLVALDLFRAAREEIKAFSALGPLCSIDDGGRFCEGADYLLDIIPSMPRDRSLFGNAALKANCENPALIDLPKSRRAFPALVKKALVCVSGETRAELSSLAAAALKKAGVEVLEVTEKNPVPNLRERLAGFDLVVTHYGFTAFEAVAAGCAVVLLSTSGLHKRLAKKYGFFCLDKKGLSAKKIAPLLQNPERLDNKAFRALLQAPASSKAADGAAAKNAAALSSVMQELSFAQKFPCPVCGAASKPGMVVARSRAHTFRRCPSCSMIYLAFSTNSRVQYEADYFGSEYKAQYGKTYLDDFDSIKAQGARRARTIRALLGRRLKREQSPDQARLLDIGCAYGPFLAAAKDLGFEPYGTDISKSALEHVKEKLGFKAVLSSFADFDPRELWGFDRFDAVTMWYVIEHCRDLDALLRRAGAMLKRGGVFAFSTPSAQGVSGRWNRASFFEQSPRDHYTVWEPSKAAAILRRYGFKVVKIVPTGIHPERIGIFKKLVQKPFIFKALALFCKLFALGDTFEIYCAKVGDGR